MKKVPIIGLSGDYECGKDTAANFLGCFSYQRAAFADELRREVFDVIDHSTEPKNMPVEIQEAWSHCLLMHVWAKPTTPHMRTLLEWWGEYRRGQNPDYWVDKLYRSIDPMQDCAISDVRYANEAAFVKRLGGEVWRITGRGGGNDGIKNHPSKALDFPFDRVIDNSGSIDHFRRKVEKTLMDARFSEEEWYA